MSNYLSEIPLNYHWGIYHLPHPTSYLFGVLTVIMIVTSLEDWKATWPFTSHIYFLDPLPREFVLVASSFSRSVYAVEDARRAYVVIQVPSRDRPMATVYSTHTGYLYWVTAIKNTTYTVLRRSHIKTGGPVQDVITLNGKRMFCSESRINL